MSRKNSKNSNKSTKSLIVSIFIAIVFLFLYQILTSQNVQDWLNTTFWGFMETILKLIGLAVFITLVFFFFKWISNSNKE